MRVGAVVMFVAITALVGVIRAAARGEMNTSLALIIAALAVSALIALVGAVISERDRRRRDGD
jgi:hypothetical protein